MGWELRSLAQERDAWKAHYDRLLGELRVLRENDRRRDGSDPSPRERWQGWTQN
jgi:hypothetical protein